MNRVAVAIRGQAIGRRMYDTMITLVGNALNTPEFRRLEPSQVLVANFKVATTSRRYDRQSNKWVDGSSLRVRVNCWRRLAENVGQCVHVGDPLIITGRLYSREWEGEDNIKRISYELDAAAVGHDLSRGVGRFSRQKASLGTIAVEDDDADSRVNGERSVSVAELNNRPRVRVYDEELGGYVTTTDINGMDIGSGFSSVGGLPGNGPAGGEEADPFSGDRELAAAFAADRAAFDGNDEHEEDRPDESFDSSAFAELATSRDVFAAEGVGGEDESGEESDGEKPDEGSSGEEPSRRRRRTKVGASA